MQVNQVRRSRLHKSALAPCKAHLQGKIQQVAPRVDCKSRRQHSFSNCEPCNPASSVRPTKTESVLPAWPGQWTARCCFPDTDHPELQSCSSKHWTVSGFWSRAAAEVSWSKAWSAAAWLSTRQWGVYLDSAFEHLSTMSGTQVLDSSNPPFYRWFPGPAVTEPLWVWMLPDEGGSEAKQCKAPKGSRFRKYCLELRLVSCGRCSSSSLSFLMVSLGAQLNMCYNAVDRHVEEGDVPAQTIDSIDFCTAPCLKLRALGTILIDIVVVLLFYGRL